MSDLSMSVLVHRDLLGTDPLELNDFEYSYIAASTFLGGTVTWNRQQVTSPWMDGAATTNRTRAMVNEQAVIEVLGDSVGDMRANAEAIVQAMLQDDFVLEVQIEDTTFVYQCEAADYGMPWSGPRFIANQNQLTFTIPRQPVPLAGVL